MLQNRRTRYCRVSPKDFQSIRSIILEILRIALSKLSLLTLFFLLSPMNRHAFRASKAFTTFVVCLSVFTDVLLQSVMVSVLPYALTIIFGYFLEIAPPAARSTSLVSISLVNPPLSSQLVRHIYPGRGLHHRRSLHRRCSHRGRRPASRSGR